MDKDILARPGHDPRPDDLDETPHGCYEGVVYLGELVEDPETGEEVEVFEPVRCRRCLGNSR